MKQVQLLLAGVGIFAGGAFVRGCESESVLDLTTFWCGPARRALDGVIGYGHCAGCGLMEVGLLLAAVSAAHLAVTALRPASSAEQAS